MLAVPVRLAGAVLVALLCAGARCERRAESVVDVVRELEVDAGVRVVEDTREALERREERHEDERVVTGPVEVTRVVEVFAPDGGMARRETTHTRRAPVERVRGEDAAATTTATAETHVDVTGTLQAHAMEKAHATEVVETDRRWGPSPLAWAAIAAGGILALAGAGWLAWRRARAVLP